MGLAYLPDGRRMDYEAYLKSPEWKNKKVTRLAFDNWQCGICHIEITDGRYETHHLNYSRLGNEDIEHDLITLCHDCHSAFHSVWERGKTWESTPYTHWRDFSLPDTADLCIQYIDEDFICGSGEYNLCSLDTVGGIIDRYFAENSISAPIRICEDDIRLYVRNKRYDLFFEAAAAQGFDMEAWLDKRFGPKGGPGGNPKRAEARRFFTKHKPGAMKRIYKENDNILILMKEVERKIGGSSNAET